MSWPPIRKITLNKKPKDLLGDRIKSNYEDRQRFYLTRRTPVIIRVDGKCFHTLLRDCDKPFDLGFIDAMVDSAKATASMIQGFKAAYIQSDEVSFLLTDYDTLVTDAWFDYNKSKMETITASAMTHNFSCLFIKKNGVALFDARSFNVPREEVSNYFLWRCKDWERNSLGMYCKMFFSHKELDGKSKQERHEMFHEKGKNWATDLDPQLRNGTFLIRTGEGVVVRDDIMPSYPEISKVIDPLLEEIKDGICQG